MDLRVSIVMLATTSTALVIIVVTPLLEVSPPWREFIISIGPAAACFLAAGAVQIWPLVSRNREKSRATVPASDFIGRVMDVEAHWSHPLSVGAEALSVAQSSFAAAVAARNKIIRDLSGDESALVIVCERIVELSVRTTDSLLSLLRAGHPDTAMGVARTLFELNVNLQIIALDRTGLTAARFREFQEGEFLENLEGVPGGLSDQRSHDRLQELRDKYGRKTFPRNSNEWIISEDGKPLKRGMSAKLEYLYEETGHTGRALQGELMRIWVWLNQWAHGTQVSAYRRIAARHEDGYLVWKREDGLNAPMVIAFITLQEIMTTYLQLSENLTGETLGGERDKLQEFIGELEKAISGVDPDLLSRAVVMISESDLTSKGQR